MFKKLLKFMALSPLPPQCFIAIKSVQKPLFLVGVIMSFASTYSTAQAATTKCSARIVADQYNLVKDLGLIPAKSSVDCGYQVGLIFGQLDFQTVATLACDADVPDQSTVIGQYSVDANSWQSSWGKWNNGKNGKNGGGNNGGNSGTWKDGRNWGVLTNIPAGSVTVSTCPLGSINLSQSLATGNIVTGGVTPDGKCMNAAVAANIINSPVLPPRGTFVGAWGFTWGAELHLKVAAVTTTTQTAAQCHF